MLKQSSAWNEAQRQGITRVSYASGQSMEGPPVYKTVNARIDRRNRWTSRDTARTLGEPLPARSKMGAKGLNKRKAKASKPAHKPAHASKVTCELSYAPKLETAKEVKEYHEKRELARAERRTQFRDNAMASIPEWKG